MNDPPQLLRPAPRHASGGQSPTRQRVSDDILAHITPATAVEALKAPTHALGRCLAGASVAEREFAMRTAVASRNIWEWVEELSEWSWPQEGGCAGFEAPDRYRRRLFVQNTPPADDDSFAGSLPVGEVARYEDRIEEIYRDMEDLAVEEIKTHVMTNHIMPLSRPATPASDAGRLRASSVSYNKMEDLTAVVTAIVVQTLPNLARLSRLLHIWSIRVGVLQRIRLLIRAIEDAEVALRSGWTALTYKPKGTDTAGSGQPALSYNDFQIMKTVIDKKVSSPGRTLDWMLDRLEGLDDTLPEDWLDRMEEVERGYAEWVAAGECKLREAEWTRSSRYREAAQPLSQEDTQDESTMAESSTFVPAAAPVTLPVPIQTGDFEEPSKATRDARNASGSSNEPLGDATPPSSSPTDESPKVIVTIERPSIELDGAYDDFSSSQIQIPTPIKEEGSPSPDKSQDLSWMTEDGLDSPDFLSPDDAFNESELPDLPNERRGSDASQTSTILHGASSHFGFSEPPEISASPGISRAKIHEAVYGDDSPNASPPSSPPLPEIDSRESSMAPSGGSPEKRVLDDEPALPKTPIDDSFSEYFEDDSFSVSEIAGTPSIRRGSTSDQQLRQQISEIIDGIPAKIKLATEPPNLNPPDLQLPRLRKKPSREPFKRSMSSMSNVSTMSTRTATPSFTLSPAKSSRPRHQRGQQEIKVYHLSRSTGEAPIKLFIRCVGENGERVMVRVGGGWADLSEYLKDYASHHSRRSKGKDTAKVEVNVPRGLSEPPRSSPPSRPASALETPMKPLAVRKTRRSMGAVGSEAPRLRPNTPGPPLPTSRLADDAVASPADRITRSRASSHTSWVEDDSSFLGLAGPTGKKVEMSEENKAWVESVKEKVRLASGERKVSGHDDYNKNKFGELGKVGGTKRLFRRADALAQAHNYNNQSQKERDARS